MGFEITLKNGYTGDIVRLQADAEETITSVVTRASSLWTLPAVSHAILLDKTIVPSTTTLYEAKVPSGAVLEIIPDPKM